MRRSVRLATYASVSLLASAVAVVGFAPLANAATLTVTTADDVVDATDSFLSLREAITEANGAAEATTIVLTAGTTYELSICAAGDEDGNASGDLDHTSPHDLTIEGNGATIEQTCDDQRVLHTIDTTPTVTLTDLTLTGGEGEGAAVHFSNDLVITGSTIAGNDGPNGVLREPGMVTASLTLTDSTVGPNTGRGIGGAFQATFVITGSTITENSVAGVDATDGYLTVTDSTVTDNGGDGLRTTGQGSGSFAVTNTVVSGNGGTGVVCSNCGDLTLTGSTVTGNDGPGIVVTLDQDGPTSDVTTTIEASSVTDNGGGGLRVTVTSLADDAPLAQTLIVGSTVAGNESTSDGGAIFAESGEVRVTNSTLTENTSATEGGAITSTDGVFLVHATVVANEAPTGSQLVAPALTAFGSIVALGTGGDECEIGAGGTTSQGYNVGGDGTCDFTGTGDQNSAGDPHLGPLQNNGGPTATRLPQEASPAIDAVPAADCTVSTVDQRGVSRPQGTDCEAGAVEIAIDDDGLPTTGRSLTGLVIAGAVLVVAGGLLLGALALRRRRTS